MKLDRSIVCVGFFGPVVDGGSNAKRWARWRPTVSLFQQPDLRIDVLHLLIAPQFRRDAQVLLEDITLLSPETEVIAVDFPLQDPWDFEEVYGALHDFARQAAFDADTQDLLVHITPGSHVAQICLFLLTEARFLPGRLLQTAPPRSRHPGEPPEGRWDLIDLDLDRYDALAQRFEAVQREGRELLTGGIATRNPGFANLIDELERVAVRSDAPVLLTGPTGAGKTRLARRVYELRHRRGLLDGPMVEVNCATLRGDQAMAALFGHVKGAFTGAIGSREGLLKRADGGLLFLDEIAELGLDEQAMLLRAIEEHRFLPMGSDEEVQSRFQLIAGTCADLEERVDQGRFRDDLLARIDLWHFALPGLADRREDIEPNLDHELATFSLRSARRVRITERARARFLRFATAPGARWKGNFRELHAAVVRLGTLAEGGRIREDDVDREIQRLERSWRHTVEDEVASVLGDVEMDRFDRVQLAEVIRVCRASRSISEAGRTLFATSRAQRQSTNDADRLRKYLQRFGLDFTRVVDAG